MALRRHGVQAMACREVGITYGAPTALAARDGDFRAGMDEALEEAYDTLEQELIARAVYGTREPVVHQGAVSYEPERDDCGHPVQEVYDTGAVTASGAPITATRLKLALDDKGRPIPVSVTKRSDALLMFALKGRRRRMYADRTEVTGADGGPTKLEISWAKG